VVPDDELLDNAGISRRQLIARAGIGAAIVWTTPVLTSLRVPAGAAGTPEPPPPPEPGCEEPCAASNPCGVDPPCPCNETGDCLSAQTVTGDCECVQPECFTPCGPGNSCDPGFVCIDACCPEPFCVPLCSTTFRRPARLGGTQPVWGAR
jgi:hypothetical protein